jgi:hypothetical protein
MADFLTGVMELRMHNSLFIEPAFYVPALMHFNLFISGDMIEHNLFPGSKPQQVDVNSGVCFSGVRVSANLQAGKFQTLIVFVSLRLRPLFGSVHPYCVQVIDGFLAENKVSH